MEKLKRNYCKLVQSRGVAQPGSALAWGARGRMFESSRPDQYFINQFLKISMAYISFFLFGILWLIFSGVYEPLTLSFGVVSVLIVTAINSLLKMSGDSQRQFFV